jgi:MFS family permease
MTLTVLSPLLSSISETYSLNMSQSGFLFTAYFIGFVIFVFIGGLLADKWGKKTVTSVSLVGFTITLFLFPSSPNFYIACAIIILMGGFGGVIESVANALVSDVNPVNNSFYVNLVQVFFGIGALIGPIAAGFVVSSGISWKVCFYVLAFLKTKICYKVLAFLKQTTGIMLYFLKNTKNCHYALAFLNHNDSFIIY